MASLFKKTVSQTAPNSGGKASRASKKWWGRYRDASGVERRRPLSSDKMAAQATELNTRHGTRCHIEAIDLADPDASRRLVEEIRRLVVDLQ